MHKQKVTIGRAEYAWLIESDIKKVPSRIDTGARTSAIWASDVHEVDSVLHYKLFGKTSEHYTGYTIRTKKFTKIVVASSNGHIQQRYKIPMIIQLRSRRIKTFCTLADRSSLAFPILIGRNTLTGKFIVDVQNGPRTLDLLDQDRYKQLQTLK